MRENSKSKIYKRKINHSSSSDKVKHENEEPEKKNQARKKIEQEAGGIDFEYMLKIPKSRIAPLIGTKGRTKSRLEVESGCELGIDSSEGEVRISGNNPIKLFELRNVVLAIGRGFNPEIAENLFKKDYTLEILNIRDYAKTKNSIIRLRGRVIGEKGKSRKTIEQLTDTNICVFGKTVSIIGHVYDVRDAKRAVDSLLEGGRHANVYSWLEKRRKERIKEEQIDFNEFKFSDEEEKKFVREN